MRKFLAMAAGAAALGTAGVANAQYPGAYGYQGQYGGDYYGGSDWDNRRGSYAMFERQYQHAIEGIRHGLRDRSISRRRAASFYRELESIRREAYRSHRYGNYQHGYIQARMAQLHRRMHLKHDRGHERNDGYGYYETYTGYPQGYSGHSRDHDDDHDDD